MTTISQMVNDTRHQITATPHMRLLIVAARHNVTLSGRDILRLMFLRYRVGTRRIGGPNDGGRA